MASAPGAFSRLRGHPAKHVRGFDRLPEVANFWVERVAISETILGMSAAGWQHPAQTAYRDEKRCGAASNRRSGCEQASEQ